jgi:hypothetical protein
MNLIPSRFGPIEALKTGHPGGRNGLSPGTKWSKSRRFTAGERQENNSGPHREQREKTPVSGLPAVLRMIEVSKISWP